MEYTLDRNDSSIRLSVGVICSGWPFWGFAAQAAGLHLRWCCGTTALAKQMIGWAGFPWICSHQLSSVDILLVPSFKACYLPWVGSCCRALIAPGNTFRRSRIRLRSGLHIAYIRVPHEHVGGISTATTFFVIVTTCPLVQQRVKALHLPAYPRTTLSSVLNCTIETGTGTQHIPAKIGSAILGSGLYPLGSYTSQMVYAPCVRWPRFRLRPLDPKEYADVLDVPSSFYEEMRIRGALEHLAGFHEPLKTFSAVLQHVFMFKPGGEGVPASVSKGLVGPLKQSAVEGTVLNSRTVLERGVGENGSSTTSKQPDPVCQDTTGGVVAPPKGEPTIDNRDRNAAAAIEDKAEVRVEIWRRHLERILDIKIDPQWEEHADKLRGLLMRVYRRTLFRSYLLWRRDTYRKCRVSLRWLTRTLWWRRGLADPRNQRDWKWIWKEEKGTYERQELSPQDRKKNRHSFRFSPEERIVKWSKSLGKYVWTSKGREKYRRSHRETAEPEDNIAFLDCWERAEKASWWNWDGGSRLHFWRWNEAYLGTLACVKDARDGAKVLFDEKKLPRNKKGQRKPKDPKHIPMIREKLASFLDKHYLDPMTVLSLISFFHVPKGDTDIRMVFNGTTSGINDATHAPWFPLPTIESHLRSVEIGTWLADEDLGEMFLNFLLDLRLRGYTGVDITIYFPELLKTYQPKLWVAWTRLLMGFRPSPYLATQQLLKANNYLMGDRREESNPFHWSKIVLNLPGDPDYDPTRDFVYKLHPSGDIANDKHTYIDDLRLTGRTLKELWRSCQMVASRLNHLGLQHAARKLRELMQDAGAWAGSVVHTSEGVYLLVSLKRWEKTKFILDELSEELERTGELDYQNLLSRRGFLIYVARTYISMKPYLKGFHQTIDSWRGNQGEDGWKLTRKEMQAREEQDMHLGRRAFENDLEEFEKRNIGDTPPIRVKAAPRMKQDLEALKVLCSSEEPVKRLVRVKETWGVAYGFGDASGAGGGTGIEYQGKTRLRFGVWCNEVGEKSSNYRELLNLVLGMEAEFNAGRLRGVEVFLFTDNAVAEGAFYKGTAASKHLHELILRLRRIEMYGEMILHVIHVSGKRMIKSGIDGLSRGDTHEGVAVGKRMLEFVGLHLSADQRSPGLLGWIKKFWPYKQVGTFTLLEPNDWYLHDREKTFTNCLWLPPPAAADAASEQMAEWRHAVPFSHIHIFFVPRLMTNRWRKFLGKATDYLFEIPLSFMNVWNETMFEPLVIAISFPTFICSPFQIKFREDIIGELHAKVRRLRQAPSDAIFRTLLRKFIVQAGSISGV